MGVRLYKGNDQVFLKACDLAGVKDHKITRRQHAKWNQSRGLANGMRREAEIEIAMKNGPKKA